MDLVRKILIHLEENCRPGKDIRFKELKINGHGMTEIESHLIFINQAGFIDSEVSATKSGRVIMVERTHGLTWDGFEFLDKVKNDSIWNEIKNKAIEKGIEISFSSIITISTFIVTNLIKQ